MANLKKLRNDIKMTQQEVADLVGISLRSYKSYENDEEKQGTIKYNYILEQLSKLHYIDEETGMLELEDIVRKCSKVFERYEVNFCYLFGSYAKGKATPASDVDLLISTSVTGLMFYDLVEALREGLKKKVDLLNREQLNNNPDLINEILKDGVKIYG